MSEEKVMVKVGGIPPISEKTSNSREEDEGVRIERIVVSTSEDGKYRVEKINRRLRGFYFAADSSSN